jgi:hypothetical protein
MPLGIVLVFVGFIMFFVAFVLTVGNEYIYRLEWNDMLNRFLYRKVPAQDSNLAWVFIVLSVIMIYAGYMLEGLSSVQFE